MKLIFSKEHFIFVINKFIFSKIFEQTFSFLNFFYRHSVKMKTVLFCIFLASLSALSQQYSYSGFYPLNIFIDPKVKINNKIHKAYQIRNRIVNEITRMLQEKENLFKMANELRQKSKMKPNV